MSPGTLTVMGSGGKSDLATIDASLARIDTALRNTPSPSEERVLVIDHLYQVTGGTEVNHDPVFLCHVAVVRDSRSEALRALRSDRHVMLCSVEQWDLLSRDLERVFSVGQDFDFVEHNPHATLDYLLVYYFDGHKWLTVGWRGVEDCARQWPDMSMFGEHAVTIQSFYRVVTVVLRYMRTNFSETDLNLFAPDACEEQVAAEARRRGMHTMSGTIRE